METVIRSSESWPLKRIVRFTPVGIVVTFGPHGPMRSYIHTYIHTYIHPYTHTYTHTCMHTYIHSYIHTYTHTLLYLLYILSSYQSNLLFCNLLACLSLSPKGGDGGPQAQRRPQYLLWRGPVFLRMNPWLTHISTRYYSTCCHHILLSLVL